MDSLIDRFLGRVTNTRQGERAVALLMFAYSFLAMTAYNIFKPVSKSKFIEELGSDNLPYVLMASSVLIGILMQLYGRVIRRLPRQYVTPITQSALVAILVGFWALLQTGAAWVTVALYFFGQILGILLISQFWTLANDLYNARQAKRLFGLIGGGACLGGALGNAIITLTAQEVGLNNLLLVSAAVLSACVVIVVLVVRHADVAQHSEFSQEQGAGGREAIRLLMQSRHLRVLAAVVGLAVVGAAVVDQQLNMAAEALRVDGEGIAELLGQIGLYLSLAAFVVQVGLTSRIHRSLGIAVALLLLPVGLGASATLILFTGTIWAVGGARVLDGTLRYSLDKTTREVLFLPVPAELRFRAKPFIDVTMEKLGKALAALLILALINPSWGLGLDWRRLSYASLVTTGVWIAMALVARREYLRAFRASVGTRAIAPDALRTQISDPASIEALVEELSNPDEAAVLYAIEMLEALDKRNLITPLLLQHASPLVRAKVLRALSLSRSPVTGRWLSTVEQMVQDEHVDVRAAALRALADLAHEDATALMRRHLADAEPRVVVTAAIGLAASVHSADVENAEAAFMRLIGDVHDTGAAGRAEAATALAHVENPRFRHLLVPLLHDHDAQVVQNAIASARALGASDGLFVPGLLALLGHRSLKAYARDALVGYGEAIVPALAHALADRREQPWIRRHIPVTLARLGGQAAKDALVAALDDSDPFLRFKAVVALERLQRQDAAMALPRPVIEAAVIKETSRYYNCLTLRQNVTEHVLDAGGSLLMHAIEDKLRQSLDRTFRLLGLLHRVDDVAAARYTIEQGESRQRAAAVEYLDNLLGGAVRKRVMPILDETPLAEKVRYANTVLKSRPRDLDDTLAQLVHDDDTVIAASAIHFAARHRVWSLHDDLEYVATRRSADDGFLVEAVLWARAVERGGSTESLPVVELVDRLRAVPLFASLSVDELFRIAETGQEVRHSAGRELYQAGRPAEDVFCLLEGQLELVDASGVTRALAAPAVVNLEETLEGSPLRHGVRATEPTIGFRVSGNAFLAMASDNPLMTQDLFALLLTSDRPRAPFAPAAAHAWPDARQPAGPMDAVRLLRHDRVLARVPGGHLLTLAGSGTEVTLSPGAALFDADSPPAVYLVLRGEVRLESDGAESLSAATGTTIGVTDTLAGTSSGWRATVTSEGRALRLTRDDLFGAISDDVSLMQGLFSRALALRADVTTAGPRARQ